MSKLIGEAAGILALIIGVAMLAVLVSNNAQTAKVVTASGNAFSNILGTALSPVTGRGGGLGTSAF
jgi:hypothetical protein